ncbi:globin-like [Ornithodoros turicata]|uniref:globin-like n=1 Tax=Ornithodoros turicata TaxID=34597 RepID=UPI003139FDCA
MGNAESANSALLPGSLTASEKAAVKDTWQIFLANSTENSVAVFIELFTQFPKYKELFKDFANVPTEELAKSTKLQAHALAVAYMITAQIESLDNPELSAALVQKNARSHLRRKGVTPAHFENLKKVILECMQKLLGPKLTPDAASGWNKVLTSLVRITTEVFEVDAREKQL